MTRKPLATLTSGQAAHHLGVHRRTVIAWDDRSKLSVSRTPGGHRRYDRRMILGMRDAIQEGFKGSELMERAQEIVQDGRYDEPAELRLRMARLEAEMARITKALRDLITELRCQ